MRPPGSMSAKFVWFRWVRHQCGKKALKVAAANASCYACFGRAALVFARAHIISYRLGSKSQARMRQPWTSTGRCFSPKGFCAVYPASIRFYSTIPHVELFKQYQKADVLVFPTLCDGFGMVVTEAFAHGLPVITTNRAGAADLVRHGENGLIVPAGDAGALAQALNGASPIGPNWMRCVARHWRLLRAGNGTITAKNWPAM